MLTVPTTEEIICIASILIALGFFIQYLLNPYLHKLGIKKYERYDSKEYKPSDEEKERKFREEIWKIADERRKRSRT